MSDIFVSGSEWGKVKALIDDNGNNIKEAAERVAGEGNVKVILTHTPPFTQEMLSEEAKLILNL